MAQTLFTIRIPDSANVVAIRQRIVTAVTTNHGYSATLPDGTANPVSAAQFTQTWITERIKDEVRKYEANIDERAARQAAIAKVDSEVDLS